MNRSQFNKGIALMGLSMLLPLYSSQTKSGLIHREIPVTGEQIPIVGIGSWLTFDVKGNKSKEQNMKSVLKEFHKLGGRVIDSSPMYGSSEAVIGNLARELGILNELWVSTKIWTDGKANGNQQLHDSLRIFKNRVMVNHVHNMRDLRNHLITLQEAKSAGLIKYIAISHYLNDYHDQLGELILMHKPDIIQINYNIENPNAEERLIPLAADNGVAVIVNKPFQTGRLFNNLGNSKLPNWAQEFGIDSWAAYMLKYIISNSGVTCVIPATTQVEHVRQNMHAGTGYIPSRNECEKMRTYYMSVI